MLVLILATAVLAGCAGNETQAIVPPPTSAQATEDSGAISGNVVNEEDLPVEGATVALIEADVEMITDKDGGFAFNNLTAGSFKIVVQKLGYESAARSVEVQLGEVTSVDIQLRTLEISVDPYVVPHVFEGLIQCSVNPYYLLNVCDGVTGDDTSLFFFEVLPSQDEWQEVLFELTWTPTTAATGQALEINVCDVQNTTTAEAVCSDAAHYWEYQGGENPQVLRLDDLPLEETTFFQVAVGANWLSPSPAVQQQFTLYVSHCYVEECSEEFTALPPG